MTEKISRQELYEFLAILVVSAAHVVVALFVSERAAAIFNILAVVLFAGYVIFQAARNRGVWREWGFRLDNLRSAFWPYVVFLSLATIFLFIVGAFTGGLVCSGSFLLAVLCYPLWGLAQQFVLQNFVARYLSAKISSSLLSAFVTSLLFGLSHIPNIVLGGWAFLAGVALTMIYRKHPNLWLVGIAHGVLASLVFYWVLQLDFLHLLVNLGK